MFAQAANGQALRSCGTAMPRKTTPSRFVFVHTWHDVAGVDEALDVKTEAVLLHAQATYGARSICANIEHLHGLGRDLDQQG